MKQYNLILSILLSTLLFSCTQEKKSELVQRLEEIFYNDSFATVPGTEFNVADYGAVADGKTLATEAIQKTIDAAAEAGGGKVTFPAGTYLSGALFVKSNVELNISEGAIIQAIQDNSHYPRLWTRIAGIEMKWPAALINVYDESNVRITGKGVIDGNGKYWWDKFWGDPRYTGGMWGEYKEKGIRWAVDYDCERVRPVVVWESEDVLLKDFTVKRAGFWTVSLTYSTRVHVDGVVVRNNIGGHGPSSDGINTDSSKDILVENCDIDCNDDNLCIKAGKDADGLRVNRPAENIVYRNCITRSGHGLITLGSETSGGMRNIEVYGLEAIGTNIGIRFKSAKVRGGLIENIHFHDIKMIDVANPFHFELNWYPEYSYCTIPDNIPEEEIKDRWRVLSQRVEPAEKGIPEFRNITLSNIKVEKAERAFYANAYPEKPIHDIHFKDVSVEAKESGKLTYASNWTMENVLLKTVSGKPVELENSENIEQPEIVRIEQPQPEEKKELTLDQQIRNINPNADVVIIPVNPTANQALVDGDTTEFSENIKVYILKAEDAVLSYYEPLGDGFYYTPVEVAVKNNGTTLEITGQKEHQYTFIVNHDEEPEDINEADQWEYDSDRRQINIEKKGKSFTLDIE
ncbi:glycoside hydrolase family 28 protein [Draconibacterium halophilum]|uniref:Glycoside hydrolase family 28 protein n=1 Tax=Draconibacterium halophilum TaxID=2706887 RepID=A0A6C0RBR3_9BACT|nr:glycoside hydrolase family 28 protein [Draconibacterium halophilum]QIA07446.1 glycoside hydrolase family 28 protein [Draconibacterium halophilum]